MQATVKLALLAALSAAALPGNAAPGFGRATPILTGSGETIAPILGPLGLELTLVQLPDGRIEGYGTQYQHAVGGQVDFAITSFMFVGDMLCVAGPITSAVNVEPPYVVGNTAAVCVLDNGNGGSSDPDESTGGVGPPGLTIQQIIAAFGPPPPEAFQPLTEGNFTIH